MLDHIGVAISNIDRSEAFYTAALQPLGITKLYEYGPDKTDSGGTAIGFGKDMMPFFRIGDNERVGGGHTCRFRRVRPRHCGRFLCSSDRRQRQGQWCSGSEAQIPPQLLRRLRSRPRRDQCRSGLPQAGIANAHLHHRL